MSYCRFASDGFQSDVYVYESGNGFVINIAQYSLSNDWTYPSLFANAPTDEADFLVHATAVIQRQQEWMRTATRTKIERLHSGDTFNIKDRQGAADRLMYLRGLGYHVPQVAIDALLEDK